MGTVPNYEAGATIFRQNETTNVMYVVPSGSVATSTDDTLIETIHVGEAFGILSLIDGQPIPITAQAEAFSDPIGSERRV